VIIGLGVVILLVAGYVIGLRFHLRQAQLIEGLIYFCCAAGSIASTIWYWATAAKRRENAWPHPPLFVSQKKDRAAT
jgi:predicted Na+-dependent transporter